MGRHKRNKARKRNYMHARSLDRRLDDEAIARDLAWFGLPPADDAEMPPEEFEPPSPAAVV